jgi:hypothetical protein
MIVGLLINYFFISFEWLAEVNKNCLHSQQLGPIVIISLVGSSMMGKSWENATVEIVRVGNFVCLFLSLYTGKQLLYYFLQLFA